MYCRCIHTPSHVLMRMHMLADREQHNAEPEHRGAVLRQEGNGCPGYHRPWGGLQHAGVA